VTNYHVVEEAENYSVRTRAGTLPATLVKADKTNDLALLKVSGTFAALPLATRPETLGQPVFTIGFPNPEVQGTQPKLTRGEIRHAG